jgi:hypothetical protein
VSIAALLIVVLVVKWTIIGTCIWLFVRSKPFG